MYTMRKQLFELGQIVATPGVLDLGLNFMPYLVMHANGYWGDLGQEDWQENHTSVKEGFRILSAYNIPAGRIWFITEGNRTSTCILLPSEY
jgi:hypothetical protein